MWIFAISLVVVLLYPGSLLLPAIFGFIVKFFVFILATIVGDLVDTNPRMRGKPSYKIILLVYNFYSNKSEPVSSKWSNSYQHCHLFLHVLLLNGCL